MPIERSDRNGPDIIGQGIVVALNAHFGADLFFQAVNTMALLKGDF